MPVRGINSRKQQYRFASGGQIEITLAGENGANPSLKTHSRSAVLILFLLLCQCLRYASVRIRKAILWC